MTKKNALDAQGQKRKEIRKGNARGMHFLVCYKC